ncbi:hypothetical protein NQ314_010223 [Rhamnusium bicolor]|uniref:MADF domain-containing protein n=1 Tax=Rhamnusium bicolor TaxID=1586634 RepID=A0AAV8XSE9_9CUCU|nr:hypothetical protein NQ314_010223 [Rhamnusium bicolor]
MASKEFISGLIALYRDNPCLWKTTIPEYTNKNIKNKCYKGLVDYSKQFFKEADKKFVQQKLQNLRTAFRKEFKKVEDSNRSGVGTDDLYVPKLWYYDLLLFTNNDVIPCSSVESRKRRFSNNTISQMDNETDNETEDNEDNEEIEDPEESLENCETRNSECTESLFKTKFI